MNKKLLWPSIVIFGAGLYVMLPLLKAPFQKIGLPPVLSCFLGALVAGIIFFLPMFMLPVRKAAQAKAPDKFVFLDQTGTRWPAIRNLLLFLLIAGLVIYAAISAALVREKEVSNLILALDSHVTTAENNPVELNLGARTFKEADLEYLILEGPLWGSMTNFRGNLVDYIPRQHFHGEDKVTFKATDGRWFSNEATISITVLPVNDAPITKSCLVVTNEDTPVSITLGASDPDNNALTYYLVDSPIHGKAGVPVDNVVTYQPDKDFNGVDFFTFRASDGVLESDLGVVTVLVNPVNDPPRAFDLQVITNQEEPVNIWLQAEDPEEDPLTFIILSFPAYGEIVQGDKNRVTYIPREAFTGEDRFTFGAQDRSLKSNTATIEIVVKTPSLSERNGIPSDNGPSEAQEETK